MGKNLSDKINDLFEQEKWQEARKLLEAEREMDPESHWIVTQLGVTLYEERRYKEALRLFLASRKITPDCPLTLWNLAGTLDALGKTKEAIRIFNWLLESKKSHKKDPCWESSKWTESLKADCIYRLGVCFRHLGKKKIAEHCYREYMNLVLTGIDGSYAIDDVAGEIQRLQNAGHGRTKRNLLKAVSSTLRASGFERGNGQRHTLPESLGKLVTARRVAKRQ